MLHKISFIIKFLFLVAIFSILVLFFSNNCIDIQLNLYPFNYIIETKLFVLMAISFILGFLFSVIFDCINKISNYFNSVHKKKINKLREQVKELKSEIGTSNK